MAIGDRLTYAALGALFGAVLGLICWWLYGLGMSLNIPAVGESIDPVLQHWLTWVPAAFGLLGFVFQERVADMLGDALNAIFHFELSDSPGHTVGLFWFLVFVVLLIGIVWFSAPV